MSYADVVTYLKKEGLSHIAEDIAIEWQRCKGHETRERLMLSRVHRPRDTWDYPAGYYIRFTEPSAICRTVMDFLGPYETLDDMNESYNSFIRLFGFDKSLLIGEDEDEDDWFGTEDSWFPVVEQTPKKIKKLKKSPNDEESWF